MAKDVVARLVAEGIEVALLPEEAEAVNVQTDNSVLEADPDDPPEGCELVVVLGGDGTILRGAELSRGTGVPLLGVNLGHVGFLAEAEREDLRRRPSTASSSRDYDGRGADDPRRDGPPATARCRTACWALNEVSVEKAARERMLEVAARDRRPAAVDASAATGSSSPPRRGRPPTRSRPGGPVVWPDVEAILMVPIAAHALFSRPLVVGPTSRLAVEVIPQTEGRGRHVVRRTTAGRAAARRRGSR